MNRFSTVMDSILKRMSIKSRPSFLRLSSVLFKTLLDDKLLTHTLVQTVIWSRGIPASEIPFPTWFSFLYACAVSMNRYPMSKAAETLAAH